MTAENQPAEPKPGFRVYARWARKVWERSDRGAKGCILLCFGLGIPGQVPALLLNTSSWWDRIGMMVLYILLAVLVFTVESGKQNSRAWRELSERYRIEAESRQPWCVAWVEGRQLRRQEFPTEFDAREFFSDVAVRYANSEGAMTGIQPPVLLRGRIYWVPEPNPTP